MATTTQQETREKRGKQILDVFNSEFGDLLSRDPGAFQTKFRKMAASAFAFYRGGACLFYHDLKHELHDNTFLDDRTSRVWIHGDLHAENFGTYMDARGRLMFNVNDFDEAYVGPFTWDLKRFAASLALLGHGKALSDGQITQLVQKFAGTYHDCIHAFASGAGNHVPRFTLNNAKGPVLEALHSARSKTRADLLSSMTEVRDYDRRFSDDDSAVKLDDDTRRKVLAAFDDYLDTLPEPRPASAIRGGPKDVVGRRGVGIGSAGLPSYNILLDGNTDALEDNVILYMKQAQKPAVSQHVNNAAASEYFKHEGHRTVISQRALQAHADPWCGWAELDGVGQLIAEISPYALDLDWSDIDDPDDMVAVVADLGQATAIMHSAADEEGNDGDDDGEQPMLVNFSAEKAIDACIADDKAGFTAMLVQFALEYGERVRQDHQIFVDLFRNGDIPGLPSVKLEPK